MPLPEITRVLAAESVSNFGSMLSRLVIPWLAALVLQATPMQMAALLVADVLAAALGSLLLAAWVDRSGKRAVMLWADGLRLVLMLGLAAATWWGWVSLGWLVLVAAANGVLAMAFELARSAWLAQRVQVADLPQRNAQLSMVGSLSETAAFAIGGWLYQGLGATLSFVVDACSYAASALCLRGVSEVRTEVAGASDAGAAPSKTAAPATTATTAASALTDAPAASAQPALRRFGQESAAGMRAIAQRPALRALAGIEALGSFSFALTGTVYTIYVTRELGVSTAAAGMVAALGGAGAVLGAALAPRLGQRIGRGRTMALGLSLFALGGACIPLAGWAAAGQLAAATPGAGAGVGVGVGVLSLGVVAWLVAHQVVGDAGHTLHDVHDRTLRQTAVPPQLLARADAGIRSVGQIALLLGAGVGGVLGTTLGSVAVLWLATAAAAAAALLAVWRLAER